MQTQSRYLVLRKIIHWDRQSLKLTCFEASTPTRALKHIHLFDRSETRLVRRGQLSGYMRPNKAYITGGAKQFEWACFPTTAGLGLNSLHELRVQFAFNFNWRVHIRGPSATHQNCRFQYVRSSWCPCQCCSLSASDLPPSNHATENLVQPYHFMDPLFSFLSSSSGAADGALTAPGPMHLSSSTNDLHDCCVSL